MKIVISAALVLLALGIFLPWDGGPVAWMPSESEVAHEFAKKHPDLQVIEVRSTTGDNDGKDFIIQYSVSPDKPSKWAIWSIYASGNLYGWTVSDERMNQDKPALAQ